MSMRDLLPAVVAAGLLAGGLLAGPAVAESPGLGQPLPEADVKPWDITILPDGTNLPPGSGTAAQGAALFAERCAACHGEGGKGGTNNQLVGGVPLTTGIDANKTIVNFWEYSTTLFDFIRRAMPWPTPRTLTDNETYALVAFILAQNKLIPEAEAMNAQTLPKVRMPNRDGFIIRFPDKI
jgi:S-disulfanyl-L-cysteine oxidoreductase SoxD